jgi:hypothetical protein
MCGPESPLAPLVVIVWLPTIVVLFAASVICNANSCEPLATLLVVQREQAEQRLAGERRKALDRGGERGEQRGTLAAGRASHRAQRP